MIRAKSNGFERVFAFSFSFVVFVFCAVFPSPISAELRYQVTEVANTSEYYFYGAFNNRGQAFGTFQSSDGYHICMWENGVMNDLGRFGDSMPYILSVSDDGLAVGWTEQNTGEHYSFKYNSGNVTNLGTDTVAIGVNNFGQIVGNIDLPSGSMQAVIWNSNVPENLATLGGMGNQARDINDSGKIVGSTDVSGSSYIHAALWEDDMIIDLGTLSGEQSNAMAINDSDQIVGYSDGHACLWENGLIIDLGTLPNGTHSEARDINNAGLIVGKSELQGSAYAESAFLYSTNTNTMYNLNEMIEPASSNWYIYEALSINDAGWILAYSVLNNETYVTVLTPVPEPGMIMLISAGLLMFRIRKRNFVKF